MESIASEPHQSSLTSVPKIGPSIVIIRPERPGINGKGQVRKIGGQQFSKTSGAVSNRTARGNESPRRTGYILLRVEVFPCLAKQIRSTDPKEILDENVFVRIPWSSMAGSNSLGVFRLRARNH